MKAFITFLILIFGACIWPSLMFELGMWITAQGLHRLITVPCIAFCLLAGAFGAFIGLSAPAWVYYD